MIATNLDLVYRYHDGTKHDFNRFARSLGYLDWASQPRPFRSFHGAPALSFLDASGAVSPWPTPPESGVSGTTFLNPLNYDELLAGRPTDALPVSPGTIGHFFRYALGLSAWKVFRDSRWSLRVNPSSGNLHPTEAYLIEGGLSGLAPGEEQSGASGAVWHYTPDRHAIERRCVFEAAAWRALDIGAPADGFLVALTSIHWRESWKYGERAFRYCQHDLGHAVAALRLSAALFGWRATMLPSWSQTMVATTTGIDRDDDYVEAEREEPACLLLVTTTTPIRLPRAAAAFVEAVRGGRWSGRASQLSEDHVQWTFIDEVANATNDRDGAKRGTDLWAKPGACQTTGHAAGDRRLDARTLILQRRSALALDGVSSISRSAFLALLSRLKPHAAPPWDVLWWTPRIHLALFVHRVDGLAPGLYLLARSPAAIPALQAALSSTFLWEEVADSPSSLWLLEPGDFRGRALRVSCDQEIAADGFFSLGMLAEFDGSLIEHGAAFYRQLFWESGVVGQVLYLEAEAAGAGGTGIGCFYDDAVHEILGLRDHTFQSLYHFTIGVPVIDTRLTTEKGY